jgi:hypothetical protein
MDGNRFDAVSTEYKKDMAKFQNPLSLRTGLVFVVGKNRKKIRHITRERTSPAKNW